MTALVWPPRPAGRVAGAPVGVFVCWQLAVVFALAAIDRPLWPVGAVRVTAALVLALAGMRFRRRWSLEWLRLWMSYRLRHRRVRVGGGARPEYELVRRAAAVREVTEISLGEPPDGVAMVDRVGASAVVLELGRDALVPAMLALPAALLPDREPTEPDVGVQLVMQVRPSPHGWRTWAWLAVQVFRDGQHDEAQVRHALAVAVRTVRCGLRERGYAAQVLGVDGLWADLRVAAQLDVAGASPGGALAVETWHGWRTPGLSHRTLRVSSWTPLDVPAEPLVTAMLTADGLGTTVTLGARNTRVAGGARAVGLELAVRLTERSDSALDAAVRTLRRGLVAAGARVEPMDGRAARGLATTLPLGGFAA
jgi:type VII secretion protein EccE